MKRTRRASRSAVGAERVEHLAVGAAIERVDGEVAPARVGRPVVGEGDGGVAAVRLDVLAQRRDLVGRRGSAITVTVPWAMPVGTAARPAARPRRSPAPAAPGWRCRCRRPAGPAARCARRRRPRAPQSPRRPARRTRPASAAPREPIGPGKARQLAGRRRIGHDGCATSAGRARCARPCPCAGACRSGPACRRA